MKYPTSLKLREMTEGSDFRDDFDIIQQKKDPNFYVAFKDTNNAIGRLIYPKDRPVNGSTVVMIQWFEEAKLPDAKPKQAKKK